MLLQDLYNTLSDTNIPIAVKDLTSNSKTLIILRENGKTSPETWGFYHDQNVCCWHCEPNMEDNGVINWKNPCRVIIEVC